MRPNPAVERMARKLRLQVPSALWAPAFAGATEMNAVVTAMISG